MKEKTKLTKELIGQVASIARLHLTESEKEIFLKDFQDILDAFSKLDECDTKDTLPSVLPVRVRNNMREDESRESLTQEDALKNAKHKKEGYFKGPRAI